MQRTRPGFAWSLAAELSVSPTHETLLEREGLLAIIWPDHGVRDPLGAIGGQRT